LEPADGPTSTAWAALARRSKAAEAMGMGRAQDAMVIMWAF